VFRQIRRNQNFSEIDHRILLQKRLHNSLKHFFNLCAKRRVRGGGRRWASLAKMKRIQVRAKRRLVGFPICEKLAAENSQL
jgi:hypothetical protein